MKRIFNTTEAQLTRLLMSDEIMYVSKATQKAFIEINEEGAEVSGGNGKFFPSSMKSRLPYYYPY